MKLHLTHSHASYPSAGVQRIIRVLPIVILAMLLGLPSAAQEVMRVTGKIVSKEKKMPLYGVNVTDVPTGRKMATSDEDGRFAIDVRSNTTLRFSMVGAKPASVKVKHQNYLEVELEEEDMFLGEAVVAAKRITDKVMPEPTDIEIKGNYAYIRTRVRVPSEMFSHDTRLVMQPVINNATRGQLTLMRPLVYDAREYHRTQDRLYNFRMDESPEGDPLASYVTIKADSTREAGRRNDIIGYADSIYLDNVRDEFTCDIYMAIEDYRRILYRDTTIIARGTVNPLRWLDYSFSSKEMDDEAYFPKPETQLRDTHGEVNLRFPVGKAAFDRNDSGNAAEVEKLRRQIESISQNKDATLQALTMHGTSSPEGRYTSNLTLAQRRMDFAVAYLQKQVPEEMRRGMKFKANAEVATWTEVARLMRADSLHAEADQVEAIVKRYASRDMQSNAVRRLPFYSRIILPKYLPQLRRVDYVMNYSVFRQLTIDEIRELYQKDYRQLSRFEFFKLYRAADDPAQRETILRQALEMYPSFLTAANDLEALLIARGASDPEVLRPFAGERAPQTVNTNQMIALLNAGHFPEAVSIASFVRENDDTRMLLAVNAVLNGRYAENFNTVANTGKRNELVLLLAMKRNEEALELSKQLPDDEALSHYLRATCLNRMEHPVEAYEELKKAFQMDPSLKRTAELDGDVNDLLLDKQHTKQ